MTNFTTIATNNAFRKFIIETLKEEINKTGGQRLYLVLSHDESLTNYNINIKESLASILNQGEVKRVLDIDKTNIQRASSTEVSGTAATAILNKNYYLGSDFDSVPVGNTLWDAFYAEVNIPMQSNGDGEYYNIATIVLGNYSNDTKEFSQDSIVIAQSKLQTTPLPIGSDEDKDFKILIQL